MREPRAVLPSQTYSWLQAATDDLYRDAGVRIVVQRENTVELNRFYRNARKVIEVAQATVRRSRGNQLDKNRSNTA